MKSLVSHRRDAGWGPRSLPEGRHGHTPGHVRRRGLQSGNWGNALGMAHDEHGWTDVDEPRDSGEVRGTGVSKWSLPLLVVAIVLAVVLGQNTERVDVDVLWASFRVPLFLVVLLAALGLTLLWEVATLALRQRRRLARRN
jgi:uncharacterized integral membrane protein